MVIAVSPLRPDTMPQLTRFVQVADVILTVSITREERGWLASHPVTGCFGYGVTIECAVRDITLMLANERDWFVLGEGARMYLYGRMHERRAAIQRAFGYKETTP